MARFALSAVVAAIAFVGSGYNPGVAAQAFAVTYGLSAGLDPNQKVNAPYPDLSRVPGANYGDPLPYVIGVARVPGVVVWASDKRAIATTTTTGGKGPPGVDSTTYTTVVDVFVLLTANEMQALRRVWSYGKLVWTQADDADTTSLADSATTDSWERITFYTGAAGQLPDPDMEAFFGVGNTPAYRHRSGVFIKSLVCAGGDQLPLLNFEVCQRALQTEIDEVITPFFNIQGEETFNFVGIGAPSMGAQPYIMYAAQPDSAEDPNPYRAYEIAANGDVGDFTETPLPSDIPNTAGALHGSTDASSLVMKTNDTNEFYAVFTGLSPFYFTRPGVTNQGGDIMCKRGNLLVVTDSQSTYDPRIDAFTVTGTFLASSPLLSDNPKWLAISASNVYAVLPSGNVVVMDATTMAVEDTYTTPVASPTAPYVMVDEANELYWWDARETGSVYKWSGSSWDVYYQEIELTAGNPPIAVSIEGGFIYRAVTSGRQIKVERYGGGLALIQIPLDEVMDDLYLRTGILTTNDFDNSAYASKSVRGLSVNQVTTTRAVVEVLQSGYLITVTEGDQLIGGNRGEDAVETIPYEDMGASESDPIPEPLPIRRLNDIEQASRVTIKYLNAINDYQTGAEAGERLITESTSEAVTQLALALTPGEAKRLADVATMDVAVGMLSIGPVNVTRKYAHLEVNDVVSLVNSDDSSYRCRITKITDSGLIRTLELVLDDATIINSAAATDDSYTSTNLVRNNSPTVTELFDGPILRDADNDAGFYALQNGGERWPGGTLRLMPDGVTLATITERAIFGTCSTTLGDWTGPRVFDEVSTVTVSVNGELSSSTRDAILNDQSVNAYAIGVDGRWECGQFRTASLVSPGIYILSGLLRGSRGTEWAMTDHTSGETFLLLQARGMRRVPMETGQLGIERTYRGVTLGRQIDTADDELFTNMGVGLKPFSPFDLRASRDSGDITFTWQRRSRLSTRTIGPLGISIPLGESVEAYSIDIYDDNTYTTVVRTLTSTTTSVEYSAADQTTDFGSPQATVYVGVYQLSAQVGRGTELQAAA